MISVIPKKTLIVGFHFSKFGCCKPILPESTPLQSFFFSSLANFLRIGVKNNSNWIAQNISSKKIKQVLQRNGRGTEAATELLKKRKWATSRTLLKIFSQYFEWVLSYWCFDGQVSDQAVVKFCKVGWGIRQWYLLVSLGFWKRKKY